MGCAPRSQLDCLDFVVNLEIERVEVADETLLFEGNGGWLEAEISLLNLLVERLPFLVHDESLFDVLLYAECLALLWLHFHGFLEGVGVDLL